MLGACQVRPYGAQLGIGTQPHYKAASAPWVITRIKKIQ